LYKTPKVAILGILEAWNGQEGKFARYAYTERLAGSTAKTPEGKAFHEKQQAISENKLSITREFLRSVVAILPKQKTK